MEVDVSGSASHPQAKAGSLGQHANVPSHLSVSGPSHVSTKRGGGRPVKDPHLLAELTRLREQNSKPVIEGGVLHAGSQSAAVAESGITGGESRRECL